MKSTILGGVLFLVPLVVVAIILQKAFEISKKVAAPLDRLIPIDSFAGVALANILAALLILVVCFVAGTVARGAWVAKHAKKLDSALVMAIPGYAIIKEMIAGVADEDGTYSDVHPVLVRFDDYDQIAFQIESTEENCTIFLPDSPDGRSGASVIVDAARVTQLNLPTHQIMSMMRALGRGSLEAHPNFHRTGAKSGPSQEEAV